MQNIENSYKILSLMPLKMSFNCTEIVPVLTTLTTKFRLSPFPWHKQSCLPNSLAENKYPLSTVKNITILCNMSRKNNTRSDGDNPEKTTGIAFLPPANEVAGR